MYLKFPYMRWTVLFVFPKSDSRPNDSNILSKWSAVVHEVIAQGRSSVAKLCAVMFYDVRDSCWWCFTVSCLPVSSGALTGAEVLWSGRSGCWQTDIASRHGNYLQLYHRVTTMPCPWPLDRKGHRVNDRGAGFVQACNLTNQSHGCFWNFCRPSIYVHVDIHKGFH